MRLRAPVVAALVALAASSCTLEQAYRRDTRVDILAPAQRARVSLPVTLRWSVDDFRVVPPAWSGADAAAAPEGTDDSSAEGADRGYFAVFVDRPPIAPGAKLLSLASWDLQCSVKPGCPDAEYFAERGIHLTSSTEVTLTQLPDRRGRDVGNDWHEATIVFVNDDRTGMGEVGDVYRVGPAAFSVRFIVERP